MRTLILFRGSPGCGKSTFIKEHNLELYTLSADTIRLMYASPVLGADGNLCIAQNFDKMVWNHLFEVLEIRMQNGAFTVIDSVNSKSADMKKFKDLAEKYRYRIYLIDMTDIPMETALKRNRQRPVYKQVPDSVIENIYSRFETQKVPSGIKVIKPEEFEEVVFYKPINLDAYERIFIVGDIHGCYDPLKRFMDENFCEKNMIIFCGDYTDRGPKNSEVLSLLYNKKDDKNTILLEGNHECHLRNYGFGDKIKSSEFFFYTLPQLKENGFDDKMAREFCRKLAQCAYFTYGDETYFVCHGGLSSFNTELSLIPAKQMIHGAGLYADYEQCADNLTKKEYNPNGIIQVNGHRNINQVNAMWNSKSVNLEGQVEFGGDLRVLMLEREIETNRVISRVLYYKNTSPICEHILKTEDKFKISVQNPQMETNDMMRIIEDLRQNSNVVEKKFGNISSFNFSRDAFNKSIWDEQTVKTRGLYIDTLQGKVFCRGYEKFFRAGERPETEMSVLSKTLHFPLKAYGKENGYLGLVSYDYYNDCLFYTTKSSPDGDYARHFKNTFIELTSDKQRSSLMDYLKKNNVTLAVEVIDPEFDPHIIEYTNKKIVGLDLIENEIDFKHKDYSDLLALSLSFGIDVKRLCYTCLNWDGFNLFLEQLANNPVWIKNTFDMDTIEGYVFEDASGFMFKLKTDYYTQWKKRRGVAASTIKRGYYKHTGSLTTPEDNYFYQWLMDHWRDYHDHPERPQDIITLRKEFLQDQNK